MAHPNIPFHEVAEIFPLMNESDLAKAQRIAEVGAVYLLREIATGRAKIGWAVDVERRAKTLQTGNPYRLQITAIIAADRRTEAGLHQLFADKKIRGEWFDDHDNEISDVFSELEARGY